MDAVQIIHDDYREIYQLLEKFIDETFYNYAMTFQLFPTQIDFYLPLPEDEIYPAPEFIQAAILTEFFNWHNVSWVRDTKETVHFYYRKKEKEKYTIVENKKYAQIIETACMLLDHFREKKRKENSRAAQRYWKRRAEKKW